ncbi:hypothetical protein ABZ508_31655 [Streptomyces lavendulocolor]|uniref:Uncharacterized protein n=1 Tax=Streptomyces lavendulocolor TaxID=67316 RepID=A0ABV2WEZ6_9ACTN|nr:hypothetical protein A4V12_12505 [Streptomyces noursei]
MPSRPPTPVPSSASESASDVVRWAAFSCALVPVVLLVYGTSFGGAAGTAVGLAAVTTACRVLLRRSERAAEADRRRTVPYRAGRHSRPGGGARRGGRHGGGSTPRG